MLKINSKLFEEREVVKIEIDNKVYSLPLIKYLPYKTVKRLMSLEKNQDIDVFFDILEQFIPAEVLDELSIKDIEQILNAWKNASGEDGETLGN